MKKLNTKYCIIIFMVIFFIIQSTAVERTNEELAMESTRKGVNAFMAGDYQTAKNQFTEALVYNNDCFEANFWIGRLYIQTAGNREEDCQLAISYLKHALELQPYGIEGDLTRSWLNRVLPRPATILIVNLASDDKCRYDNFLTNLLIDNIISETNKKGLKSFKYEKRIENIPETKEAMTIYCDNNNIPKYGWCFIIGVETPSKNDILDSEIKAGTKVVAIDCQSGTMIRQPRFVCDSIDIDQYNPLKLFCKPKDAPTRLVSEILYNVLAMIKNAAKYEYNRQVIDEILINYGSSKLFTRSTAKEYIEAKQRNNIGVICVKPQGKIYNDQIGENIIREVQNNLLKTTKYNVISSSYIAKVYDPKNKTIEQIARESLNQIDCDAILVIKFDNLPDDIIKKEPNHTFSIDGTVVLLQKDGILNKFQIETDVNKKKATIASMFEAHDEITSSFLTQVSKFLAKYFDTSPIITMSNAFTTIDMKQNELENKLGFSFVTPVEDIIFDLKVFPHELIPSAYEYKIGIKMDKKLLRKWKSKWINNKFEKLENNAEFDKNFPLEQVPWVLQAKHEYYFNKITNTEVVFYTNDGVALFRIQSN